MKRLHIGDTLEVLRDSPSDFVDCVYMDPPFNSKRLYTASPSSSSKGQKFVDIWKWNDDADNLLHSLHKTNANTATLITLSRKLYDDSMGAYLLMMALRLLEIKRCMKVGAALFLHCDDSSVHYLKMCLDSIFGAKQFRNDIVWQRVKASSKATTKFDRVKDNILLYRKYGGRGKWYNQYLPLGEDYIANFYKYVDSLGRYRTGVLTVAGTNKKDQKWRGRDPKQNGEYWRTFTKGKVCEFIQRHNLIQDWPHGYKNSTVAEKMDALDNAGLIVWPKNDGPPRVKRYLEMSDGIVINDLITDIGKLEGVSKEKNGWKTQKPVRLIERLIRSCTDRGDVVLDPFVGSGSTLIAAERTDRQWIGIDLDRMSSCVFGKRLETELDDVNVCRTSKNLDTYITIDYEIKERGNISLF